MHTHWILGGLLLALLASPAALANPGNDTTPPDRPAVEQTQAGLMPSLRAAIETLLDHARRQAEQMRANASSSDTKASEG